MTHADLVKSAAAWLKRHFKCAIVATELVTTARETPDAIGWRVGGMQSILVECKTSRGDFTRDRRKGVAAEARAGLEKWYLTPPGLIKSPAEVPAGWGLAETDGGPMVSIVLPALPVTRNRRNEIAMLYSLLLRAAGKSTRLRAATVEIIDANEPTPAPPEPGPGEQPEPGGDDATD